MQPTILEPVTFAPAASPLPMMPLAVHTFSVDEYHGMIDKGVLGAQHRVELLEGVIVDVAPAEPPHAVCDATLAKLRTKTRLEKAMMIYDLNRAFRRRMAGFLVTHHPD